MTTADATALSIRSRHRHRLTVGQRAPAVQAVTLAGVTVAIPDPAALVHLQFRRFAGCPVCNLHLRGFAARVDELRAAGVREVAVFHSDAATMRPYQGDLPFDVIADPGGRCTASSASRPAGDRSSTRGRGARCCAACSGDRRRFAARAATSGCPPTS